MICGAALFDVSVNNPLLAFGYNHIHSFKFSNDFPFCKFIIFLIFSYYYFIQDKDVHLAIAADLLGVDRGQFKKWMCNRKIVTVQEVLIKPLNVEEVTYFTCKMSFLDAYTAV